MIENLPISSEQASEESTVTSTENVTDSATEASVQKEESSQPEEPENSTVESPENATESVVDEAVELILPEPEVTMESTDLPEEIPAEPIVETEEVIVDSGLNSESIESAVSVDPIEAVAESPINDEPIEIETKVEELVESSVAEEPVAEVEAIAESPVVVESVEIEAKVEDSVESSVKEEPVEAVAAAEEEILVLDDHELEEMEKRDEEIHVDNYAGLDKEQLVKLAEQLNREQDPGSASRIAQKVRPLFYALYEHDKNEALSKFVADGGEPETFEYKHSAYETRFEQALKGIFEKRKLNQDFQNKERSKNLESKLNLLEQLRQLVDDHEHTPGFDKFKEIKEEWKKIGPVGQEHAQNLNASYYSLIERFYSLSEIYHNLKDFDRKKNHELKLELVSKIEKLAQEPLISKAMKDLLAYQDEYRSLGPVPKEKLDELRERLKVAVDALYERRRAFNEERKLLLVEEVRIKEELVAKIAEFESFMSTQARDWQLKTKDIISLQEEWKNAPSYFREKTNDLNKMFWGTFKKFMSNKNDFYKMFDKARKDILAQKQALVDEVNSLKDGEDWDGIANRMKSLQQAWKQVPPAFGKEGQKIYDDFKAGIDHFFGRLREIRTGEDKIQQDNLEAKEAICAEIESLAESGKGTRAALDELRDKFRQVGHVPIKVMQRINGRFSKAMVDLIDKAEKIADHEKERLKISILSSRSTYSSEGVKTLRNQEGYIQKRLQTLRKDVGTLEDNVAMFRMSKNAMALIEDVQKRINLSKLEIKELESQLKEIREGEKA